MILEKSPLPQGVNTPKKSGRDVQRIFFTFQEAQKFLGVSHQTLYKLMKEGLPSHKIGKKRVFLKEAWLGGLRNTK